MDHGIAMVGSAAIVVVIVAVAVIVAIAIGLSHHGWHERVNSHGRKTRSGTLILFGRRRGHSREKQGSVVIVECKHVLLLLLL